jgi:hypothetical protein
VCSDEEISLQQLISAIQWTPASPTPISYEALKQVQSKVMLSDTMKQEFSDKLTEVDGIFKELRATKTAMQQS